MTARPRILLIQHEDDCPPGMVEPWLARAGLDCDVLEAHKGRAVPAALGDHVGLVVMGGRMGAEDDADHRHLVPTKALIAGTVAGGLPFLGICLGHQLATVALGGTVSPNPAGQTIGLLSWRPTTAGTRDPLMGVLPAGAPVLHWNRDIATHLPKGCVALATAPDGTIQAARFGPRAWGVQFHPEVTPDLVEAWAEGRDPEREKQVISTLAARQAELHRPWEQLFRRFGRLALG